MEVQFDIKNAINLSYVFGNKESLDYYGYLLWLSTRTNSYIWKQ